MLSRLRAIPGLGIAENVPLAGYTRFALGGPARAVVDACDEGGLISAVRLLEETRTPWTLIGGGTNLIAADAGFPGVVVRYTAGRIEIDGTNARAEAGAGLQSLVDQTIAAGLGGLETMTGIPGWVGGAIYGNAGAYGRSIDQSMVSVRFFDGSGVREIGAADCEFAYRESVFKRHKDWIILSARFELTPADAAPLRAAADAILKIRNEKYPPSMLCAGSIFKNLLLADLPESVRARVPAGVIREGKVPSAYFLQEVGAKGMIKAGIRVASYHANLLYNAGGGTAADARGLIETLKARVRQDYGFILEEEVQYVGAVPEPKKIAP
jgi:UDP-N-acetylmuramate dehydrogenase